MAGNRIDLSGLLIAFGGMLVFGAGEQRGPSILRVAGLVMICGGLAVYATPTP